MRTCAEIFRSYGVLNSEGRHVNGTDKETNHHYGDAYEGLFGTGPRSVFDTPCGVSKEGTVLYDSDFYGGGPARNTTRENVRLMMEIGIADGSSLLAWSEVFPNAVCVGMDIHHSDKAHGDRIEFYLGDQRSKYDCEVAAGGRQFDFICEDALHELSSTLLTLFYLWPYVRPGGIYVVEEFSCVEGLRKNITELFPNADIVDTKGPFGGVEPLVVLRKPI